jgi:hypothetical protein
VPRLRVWASDYLYVLVRKGAGMNVKLVARCERHQVTLIGQLEMSENEDGSWAPDTSEMGCMDTDDGTCQETWTVTVVL